MNGSLRITEQGEVIAAKYAEPQIAHRNLETLLAATLESTLLDVEGLGDAAETAYEVLDDLAARAQRAYAELVHETPGFVEYFKASTPISEIGALNIGSRPASRKPTDGDLRPAGHPVGVGLEPVAGDAARLVRHRLRRSRTWIADGATSRLEVLQDLLRALAVLPHRAVEHGAGAGQGRHGPGRALRRTGRGRGVAAPASSTRSSPSTTGPSRCCRLITGHDDLLADNPALARSVFNRFPYLEPLNHLQVELLRRYRVRRRRRAGAARHPADHERAGDRAAQQRLGVAETPVLRVPHGEQCRR